MAFLFKMFCYKKKQSLTRLFISIDLAFIQAYEKQHIQRCKKKYRKTIV